MEQIKVKYCKYNYFASILPIGYINYFVLYEIFKQKNSDCLLQEINQEPL